MSLNDVMEFGAVVYSDGQGKVRAVDEHLYSDDLVAVVSADGTLVRPEQFEGLPDGWQLLTGLSNQDRYDGALMHESEFIGGGLESYIGEREGYYAAVIVGTLYPDERWWVTEVGRPVIVTTVTAPDATAAVKTAASELGRPEEELEVAPAEESEDAGWAIAYKPKG